MLDIGTGLRVRRRVLLVLLVGLALPLVGGCSSNPECFVVPFLPTCFDDDDDEEEEKPDDTATQTSVRVPARADAIATTMVALRHPLAATAMATQAVVPRPLDASSLRLAWLREDIVPRDDGCHLHVDHLNRAIRCSLEAIRSG